MSIQEMKEAVANLPPDALDEFAAWLNEYRWLKETAADHADLRPRDGRSGARLSGSGLSPCRPPGRNCESLDVVGARGSEISARHAVRAASVSTTPGEADSSCSVPTIHRPARSRAGAREEVNFSG